MTELLPLENVTITDLRTRGLGDSYYNIIILHARRGPWTSQVDLEVQVWVLRSRYQYHMIIYIRLYLGYLLLQYDCVTTED